MDHLKLNNSQFEKLLNLGNGTIAKAIENNSNIKDATLEKISNSWPQFSRDWLFHDKGPKLNPEYYLAPDHSENYKPKEEDPNYLKNGPPHIIEHHYAAFLPVRAQIEYIKNTDRRLFLEGMPHYTVVPTSYFTGQWIYLEVGENSPDPEIVSGDHLLCVQVPDTNWSLFADGYIYVIITANEVLIRRVYKEVQGSWTLYPDYNGQPGTSTINIEDVTELWKVQRHIKNRIPSFKALKSPK